MKPNGYLVTISLKKGFTLIELLVVVSIIVLLASLVMAAVATAQMKARDARRIADLQQYQKALEMYYSDNLAYPLVFSGLGPEACSSVSFGTSSPNWIVPKYLSSYADDPLWAENHRMPYTYLYCQKDANTTPDRQTYGIFAALEEMPGNSEGTTWETDTRFHVNGYNYVLANFNP